MKAFKLFHMIGLATILGLGTAAQAAVVNTVVTSPGYYMRGVSWASGNTYTDGTVFTNNTTADEKRVVLKFDLDEVEPIVNSATLRITTWSNAIYADTVYVYLLEKEVVLGSPGVSWNRYDGVNNWDTPGGDYDPTLVASAAFDKTTAVFALDVFIDVTELIQAAVDDGHSYASLLVVTLTTTDRVWRGDNQNNHIPTLTIESVIPEPGSLALMGLGGLLVLSRRRV